MCELVLNGIGGTTIAEAQENISWEEFQQWAAYRAKRGSLNTGYRVEVAVARLCALFINSKKGPDTPPFHIEDFAPHMDERIISLEELAEQMGAM